MVVAFKIYQQPQAQVSIKQIRHLYYPSLYRKNYQKNIFLRKAKNIKILDKKIMAVVF